MTHSPLVVGKVALVATVQRVPEPIDKKKVRSRGPNPAPVRYKDNLVISVTELEWNKRWNAAVAILRNGVKTTAPPKPPAAPVKVPPPKKVAAKKKATPKAEP